MIDELTPYTPNIRGPNTSSVAQPVGQSGSGSPVGSVTPGFLNQLYHDTDADAYWRSTGLTSADWVAIGGGFFITIPAGLETQFGITTSYEIPGLVKVVDSSTVIKGAVNLSGDQPLLTEVDFPNLVDCAGFYIQNKPALTTITIPNLIFGTDFGSGASTDYFFNGNALSQVSVDHILARCVASAGFASGTVDLSGGTASPPSSVAPGSDYDVLVQRGVTVTVNP